MSSGRTGLLLLAVALLAPLANAHAAPPNIDAAKLRIAPPATAVLPATSALARKAPPGGPVVDPTRVGPANVSFLDRAARQAAAPRVANAPVGPGGSASAGNLRGPGLGTARSGRPGATPDGVIAPGPHMLYAPSAADDPAYRTAIATLTGGTVDYFNAAGGTPSAALLATYDCVYTWASAPYSDRVVFGDRLADFVDAGGKVILGVFCTYTLGNSLGGRIMTAPYCPVTSPGGDNHISPSAYVGDGTTSLHAGVLAYDCTYRDILVTQGAGIVDGHYADGEIALAYRPDGRVIYTNGGGAAGIPGSGDWPQILSNACMGTPTAHSVLYAPSFFDDLAYRLDIAKRTGGPVNYFNASSGTPSPSLLATYDCVYTWVADPYSDRVLFGDELADFVDGGGKAILGVFCTYTGGASLGGRIMTPDYCPVTSPTGANHYSTSAYAGDGATCLHSGVTAYDCGYRDVLIAQGPGIVDGHYADGEIATAYRPDGRVVYLNGGGGSILGTGDWAQLVNNACECDLATGHRMLYAPSDGDDPAFRAAIAAQTGGVVDYFDAIAATPGAALLATYDCVFTWADLSYNDPVLFGDRLADYVNAGGRVILGVFCTYTSGNALGGQIMTPAYCPVTSPGGLNHFSLSAYVGDGTSCFHHGVLAYDCSTRDILVPQGEGIVEAHYADGEIAHAYRPDRRVVYLNGLGAPLGGTGDWPRLIANACDCGSPDGNLFACSSVGQLFVENTLTGAGVFAANLPTFPIAGSTEIEVDPAGHAWLQARDGQFFDQQFQIGSGLAAGPPVSNGASYTGLEFALGKLYGTAMTTSCGPSELRQLDPLTGVGLPIGPTGLGPISGLAFDARASALYGVTSGCAGPSVLVRFDVTNGATTVLGPTGFRAGSLEFGPGGDLFGGGDNWDGGHLYRINPATGVSQQIGGSGFGNITGLALATFGTVSVEGAPGSRLALRTLPNPSRQSAVRISFSMPIWGDAELALYDIAGRRVWRHPMSALSPGEYNVAWDGRTSSGRSAEVGVYLLRLTTPGGSRTVRQIVLR